MVRVLEISTLFPAQLGEQRRVGGSVNNSLSCLARRWWHTPFALALRRQRQEELCEFEANLAYIASSRASQDYMVKTLSQKYSSVFWSISEAFAPSEGRTSLATSSRLPSPWLTRPGPRPAVCNKIRLLTSVFPYPVREKSLNRPVLCLFFLALLYLEPAPHPTRATPAR